MILVDTSAWIEYSRGSGSDLDQGLTELIRTRSDHLASTDPVLMELLAGDSNASNEAIERLLRSFAWLPFDPVSDFTGAARIYRLCRAVGITPRGLVDCMIAQVALRTGSEVLTGDRDFHEIAQVMPLRLLAV